TYARLVEGADKALIDERVLQQQRLAGLAGQRDDRFANRNEELDEMRASGTLSRSELKVLTKSAKDGAASAEVPRPMASPINGRGAPAHSIALLVPGSGADASGFITNAGQEPAVQVRNDFRSTILWQPDVKTDGNGNATVKVKYPDSLTTWQATARVATTGNQFGIGNAATRTKQPLIVRLEAPRFFVVGDQVTVSAVINNNTEQPMRVAPALNAEGLTIAGRLIAGRPVKDAPQSVEVKPNS